jgi:predicted lipoprotein with Yx(FWY)xxD motif
LALLLALLATVQIATGCGDDDAGSDGSGSGSATTMGTNQEAARVEAPIAAKGTRVKAINSDYGRVIADGKGEAFYLFDKEGTKKAECYGACASVWPPVLTRGRPVGGKGIEQTLLGTTRRSNGKLQVTYAGHPLYYYVDDSPGTILCHDVEEFGGLWLVVKPNGQAGAA